MTLEEYALAFHGVSKMRLEIKDPRCIKRISNIKCKGE